MSFFSLSHANIPKTLINTMSVDKDWSSLDSKTFIGNDFVRKNNRCSFF